MEYSFFMAMNPPTATHQEKQVRVANGKPIFYEPKKVKAARGAIESHLYAHRPEQRLSGAVALSVLWCFPRGKHQHGELRITKPDTDNLQKLLKDCMTHMGFWQDDAQVAEEHIRKCWSDVPGIYITLKEVPVCSG